MDTYNSSLLDENLTQHTSESLCDTAKTISCQNGISSDQVPGELKAHCEIESSKTSAEENEMRDEYRQGNCGKDQVPPMNPVWLIGQNMTFEEKNWEHFLYCYDRGNCGKDQVPPMNPVWLIGQNMTFEEKNWEHFLYYFDRGNCGKDQVPPMNPVWLIGQNMTLEEKNWEHFLYCNDRSKRLRNFESVYVCINPIALCDIIGIDIECNVLIIVKRLLENATASGSQSVSFTVHQCEISQGSTEKISQCSPEEISQFSTVKIIQGSTELHSFTGTDNYLAEYNEQTEFLSLAGTSRIENEFITFLCEFKSKFFKHLYRKIYFGYMAEVTESVEKDKIDYDEEAFDAVGISLKKNNIRKTCPSRCTFNDKIDRNTHWVFSEDFEEMSHAVFSAAVTPTNEMRFDRSKIVGVKVIEQSCSNIENFEVSKYKLAIDDDKHIRAVGYEVSICSSALATLVTDYFNDNYQQQNNATESTERNNNFLIETNVKKSGSLNERLCNKIKTNLSDKQEGFDEHIDHNGNKTDIRALSLLSDLTDLPYPRIDKSYLTPLVYRIEEPLLAMIDRLASDNPPTPHISMRYELLRFCTLRTYPRGDKPYLTRLAAAGFYYASDGDGVVCYCCGSRRYNWTGREDPMKVHQGIKPSCKFLTKNEDVNVPVVYNGPWSKSLIGIEAIPKPNMITQEWDNVNREYASERKANQESVNEQQTLGINNATPKHSQYTIKSQRLGSYKDWPKTSKQKPEDLADAGFFYTGPGDCVRCFFCSTGLRCWEDDDDPWIEHARWARTCVFVRQKKGEEFVNLVQLAVQLTQDNGQAGASVEGSGRNNCIPVSTIEKLLPSKAVLSAAGLGSHTEIIKRAVEEMIRNGVTGNIGPDDLLCQVLEIEGHDERAAADTTGTAASRDTKKGNGSSLQDPVAIKHENEVIREQLLCKVCLDNTVCIVFLPCAHLVTCADCAPAMRKCFICRALITGTVRANMS